jgi:hypothetical protein
MATATAAAPTKTTGGGQQKALPTRKFRAGVQQHQESVTVLPFVPGAAGTPFTVEIPAYGFLRGLWFRVAITGGVGSGTAAVYREDAPFAWIQTIQFLDVNSAPIVFQITGYDLYLIYKYGGYFMQADPKSSEEYTQGGIGGNSVFTVYLPLELRARDALGALPNTSANTAYKVLITVAPTTEVYSTPPAPTLPTAGTVTITQDAWWEPQATDLQGRPQAQDPPSKDTTQYWSKSVFEHVASGQITDQLKRTGYLHRNHILTFRTTAPVRSTTNFPNPLTVIYEGQQMTIQDRILWRHMMARLFGYTAAVDTAGGLDTGVFVLAFNRDFGLQVGAEIGNGYLPTTTGTRIEYQGTIGSAGRLDCLVNDVSAADELDITGA